MKNRTKWTVVQKTSQSPLALLQKALQRDSAKTEGKEVLKTRLKRIDVSNLASGIYLVTIKTSNINVTQKFIKN